MELSTRKLSRISTKRSVGLTSEYVMSSSLTFSSSMNPDIGIRRCITSSWLNRSLSIRAAHRASTSEATRMIIEEADVRGDDLYFARIFE